MSFDKILIPAAIIAGLGLFLGALLAVASRIFAVKTDERIERVRELLPGANCGGCGFSGCDALAAAIVQGKAPVNGCGACNAETVQKIAEVIGATPVASEPKRAVVLCSGGDNAALKYVHQGAEDCAAALRLGGGDKACAAACIGLGSCVAQCRFGALHIENGVAVVDGETCVGCGVCVSKCPKHLIEMLPKNRTVYAVVCRSHEKGAVTVKQCKIGCIGCLQCKKACPNDAVLFENGCVSIDPARCTGCGACETVCRRKVIKRVN